MYRTRMSLKKCGISRKHQEDCHLTSYVNLSLSASILKISSSTRVGLQKCVMLTKCMHPTS